MAQRGRGLPLAGDAGRAAGLEQHTGTARIQQRRSGLRTADRPDGHRPPAPAQRRERDGRGGLERLGHLSRPGRRALSRRQPGGLPRTRTLPAVRHALERPGALADRQAGVDPRRLRDAARKPRLERRDKRVDRGARSAPDRSRAQHEVLLRRRQHRGAAGRRRRQALLRHRAAARRCRADSHLGGRGLRNRRCGRADRARRLPRRHRCATHRPVADARRQRLQLRHRPRVPGEAVRRLHRHAAQVGAVADDRQPRPVRRSRGKLAVLRQLHAPGGRRGGRARVGHGGLLLVRPREHPFHRARFPGQRPFARRGHADLVGRGPGGDLPGLDRRLLAPPALQRRLPQIGHRAAADGHAQVRGADPGGPRRRPGARGPQPLLRAVVPDRRSLRGVGGLRSPAHQGRRRRTDGRDRPLHEAVARQGPPRGYRLHRRGQRRRGLRWDAPAPRDVHLLERSRLARLGVRRQPVRPDRAGQCRQHARLLHADQRPLLPGRAGRRRRRGLRRRRQLSERSESDAGRFGSGRRRRRLRPLPPRPRRRHRSGRCLRRRRQLPGRSQPAANGHRRRRCRRCLRSLPRRPRRRHRPGRRLRGRGQLPRRPERRSGGCGLRR